MSHKDELINKLESQLKDWTADLKLLEAHLQEQGANAQLVRQEQLKKLQLMEHQARNKLHELKSAGAESLDELETRANKFWASLGRELQAYDTRN